MTENFNAKVTDIFKQEYLSPRPTSPTLQLPKHGIGNWCYPNLDVKIDDSGLRQSAKNNQITSPEGILFQTPADANSKNIAFTSMWDNFPDKHCRSPFGKSVAPLFDDGGNYQSNAK